MSKDEYLITDKPLKALTIFAMPMILGSFFQQVYNMADSIIVGQFVGSSALAAVGACAALTNVFICVALGAGVGAGVLVSRYFGARNYSKMKTIVSTSLISFCILSILLGAFGFGFSRLMMSLLQTPADILDEAVLYLQVYFVGFPFLFMYNILSTKFTSIGESKIPLGLLVFSSVLNIVLDIFFIVVVKAGTAGAAYATVISQGIAAVLSFIVMFKKYDLLRTSREDYYMDWSGIWRMLSIGLQMALNYSITAIGTMIFQAAVNVFGSQVVAAYTAASKVNNIATQTMPTLGTAAATYCGQNLGAGRYDRIFKGMKSCFFICIGCAVLAAAINCFVGPYMIGWFITSPTATDIDCAMKYLKIASVFMLPLAWIFAYRNGLQGLNKGLVPMLSGAMELVSRWIAILALSKPFGYGGVCFADPAAWLTTGILLIVTYYVWEMRMRKKIQIK